jgi:type IV pilus assembly protein PilN
MAKINLLPWRDVQRQEKKKEFFTVLGGFCILGALCSFLWVTTVKGSIEDQNARNNRLEGEIKKLEEQVKEIEELRKLKAETIARMEVIQGLQGTRPVIVHYVDDFVRAVPDGVFFTNVERVGDSFNAVGVAESYERVSDLMRNLDKSDWFKDTSFKDGKVSDKYGEGMYEFSIRTIADAPKKSSEEAK